MSAHGPLVSTGTIAVVSGKNAGKIEPLVMDEGRRNG